MYSVIFEIVCGTVLNLVLLLNPEVCIFCTFLLLVSDFSSWGGVLVCENSSLLLLAYFLLRFPLSIFCKIFTIGSSSSDNFVWVWGAYSFITSMVLSLPLGGMLLLAFSGDLSSQWFLTRKLSQLSPILWIWNSTNIFIRPWWYMMFSIHWIFFWTFVDIFLRLFKRN